MLNIPSLESIDFQHDSRLAKELTNLFQEVINIREKYTTPHERVSHVLDFCKTKLPDKFRKVVKDSIGLTVKNVNISKHLDFFFATFMNIYDNKGINAAEIMDNYSGTALDKEFYDMYRYYCNAEDPVTAKDMEVIADSLNKKSGLFKTMKLKGKKDTVFSDIYFDPNSAFLMKELGHDKLEYFTAEEIAAVMLHEIGHMMSLLEHSADTYYKIEVYKHAAKKFFDNASFSEKMIFVKNILSKSQNQEDMKKIDSNIDDLVSKVAYAEQTDSIGDKIIDGIKIFFVSLIITILNILPFIVIAKILGTIETKVNIDQLDNGFKRGDFSGTSLNFSESERLADEYVARHKMTQYLTSGLCKFEVAASTLMLGPILSRHSSMIYYAHKLPWFLCLLFNGDTSDGFNVYEKMNDRLQRQMQDVGKVFKNSDLPDHVVQAYIDDYEGTKRAFKDRPMEMKLSQAVDSFYLIIRYLINPYSLISMFTNGRFTSEYERLRNNVSALTANSLYYLSSKLNLIGKGK